MASASGLPCSMRQRAGDGVGPLAHQVGGLLEDLGPVVGGQLHPRRHRLRRGGDGPLAVLAAAEADLGDGLLGGRVLDGELLAGGGIAPCAVDEQLAVLDGKAADMVNLRVMGVMGIC